LLSALPPAGHQAKNDEDHESNSAMASLMRLLERQITDNPQDMVAADAEQMRRIGKLVKGVRIGWRQP
jgi:hypothetical protein